MGMLFNISNLKEHSNKVWRKRSATGDCLYYLEQFTRGQPRELVHSCQHIEPAQGYAHAKRLLHEHFGNEYKQAAAFMEKALAWHSIKSEE